MANLLYLVHRLPYPPNKGDKVRSFHLLRHLAVRHRVHLGTFVDDPEDEPYVDKVRPLCASLYAARLAPRVARFSSLGALLTGEALTLRYYRNAGLAQWVRNLVQTESLDAIVVFSSSMAQYAVMAPEVPLLADFVDVDSAKWTDYADQHTWPMSWLYRREGQRLLAYERQVAVKSRKTFFVTEKEVALFRGLAPECAPHVAPLCNGVDADFFCPDETTPSPFAPDEIPLVFTGAMDYWPNVDAVSWFAREILPKLRGQWPNLRLHIVGRSPTPGVRSLAGESVVVTGTVPDVRPFLQHARVVVAPLRLARGIQNKILEAMAMARPVVAAGQCLEAIDARPGKELLGADDVADYTRQVSALLNDRECAEAVGAAARQRVLQSYSWRAHLSGLDAYLPGAGTPMTSTSSA